MFVAHDYRLTAARKEAAKILAQARWRGLSPSPRVDPVGSVLNYATNCYSAWYTVLD